MFGSISQVPQVPYVVAVGGTLRPDSSTERVLKAVMARASARGAQAQIFSGTMVNFPIYVPGTAAAQTPGVTAFIEALRRADAIIIGSPSYHGGVSGLVKNAIDYIEEMANDSVPYFSGKPVGCVTTGLGWQGCNSTLQALRSIVHSLRGWPTPLGIALNTKEGSFDQTGSCTNPGLAAQADLMAEQLLTMCQPRDDRRHTFLDTERQAASVTGSI